MKITTKKTIAVLSAALFTGGGLGAYALYSPEDRQIIQEEVIEQVKELDVKEKVEEVKDDVVDNLDYANPENIVEEPTIIYEEATNEPVSSEIIQDTIERNNIITNQPVDDSAAQETPQSMVTEQEIQQNIQQQINTQNNVQPEPVSTPEPTPAPAPVQNTPEPAPEPPAEETVNSMVGPYEQMLGLMQYAESVGYTGEVSPLTGDLEANGPQGYLRCPIQYPGTCLLSTGQSVQSGDYQSIRQYL